MPYIQEKLSHLYQAVTSIEASEIELNKKKKEFNEQKNSFMKEYFEKYNIETGELPVNATTFISSPQFNFKKSDDGKVFWVASGEKISIKSGTKIYGSSTIDLWQGQWEAMPKNVQQLTLEKACQKNKPVFEISPAIFRGVDYSSPAYILHDAGDWQLVWRKSGTAYTGRFSDPASVSSGLQILYNGKEGQDNTDFLKKLQEITGRNHQYVSQSINLTQGGRLSSGLIEKESSKIDTLLGPGVAQSIVNMIKQQNTEQNQIRKDLKIKP